MSAPYRPIANAPVLTWLGLVLGWGAAISLLLGRRPGLGLAMAAGVALATYLFGWRVAVEVSLTREGDVAWRSLLSQGRAPLAALQRVRPTRWQRTFLLLELDGSRGPVVPSGRGIAAFVDALRSARPDLPIDLGAIVERLADVDRRRAA